MKATIILYTKDNKSFWAKDYSDSESLIKHLIGTRYVEGDLMMKTLEDLADAHDWQIIIKQIQ